MNLALYARVSTDKCQVCGKKPSFHPQCGHEFRGQDPEVQLMELREWCEANGHKIVEVYVDRGLSGKKVSCVPSSTGSWSTQKKAGAISKVCWCGASAGSVDRSLI